MPTLHDGWNYTDGGRKTLYVRKGVVYGAIIRDVGEANCRAHVEDHPMKYFTTVSAAQTWVVSMASVPLKRLRTC